MTSHFSVPISISIPRIYPTSHSFHLKGLYLYEWIGRNNTILRSHIQIPSISNAHLNFTWNSNNYRHYYSLISNNGAQFTAHGMSDSQSYSAEQEDSVERGDTSQERAWSTTKVLEQLKRYGVSGILSYGLLNTVYYLTTFLTVWFYFAPSPGKMGYLAAVSRFLKIMAMVWAGSQVTKLIRAAGALALAPIVDRGLSWFTDKFKFESRGKAFMTIVGFCFGLAAIMFLIVTLLSA